jgi:rod shape-determining protein MreD
MPVISLEGVVPDLLIILVVFYTLRYGQIYGMLLGFSAGLAYDLITGGVLGSMMFAKTLSAFIIGYFYNENKTATYLRTYRFALIVLLAAMINSTALSLLTGFGIRLNVLSLLIRQGVLPAVYTAVTASLITFFYPKRKYDWQQ